MLSWLHCTWTAGSCSITDENGQQNGKGEDPGLGSNFFAIVAPLVGGLRILRHESTSELSLTDGSDTRSSATVSAPTATAVTDSTAETNSAEQGQESEPEPTAADPTADDLLAVAAELEADGQSEQRATGADEELVTSRPYEMSCWFEQLADGRSQSLRPVVGIHSLRDGRLGVRPLELEDGVVPGLVLVRDDGTVQAMDLPIRW